MNRTKIFAYNSLFQAFSQIVVFITGFIVPNIILRFYGSEINGLVTSIVQFMSYFSLVEAGISAAAVYSLYKPIAQGDIDSVSGIVCAAKRVYRQSGMIFISLAAILAFLYPLYIRVSGLNYWEEFVLILLLGVSGALEFFAQGQYKVLLTAGQKYYIISISNIIYYFLYTVIVLAVAFLGGNIVVLRAVVILALVSRPIILSWYAHRKFPKTNYHAKPIMSSMEKRWDALFLQILGVVQSGAPIILLTVFSENLKVVSIYSIFNLIVGGIGNVAGIFTSGLSASFGDVIASGNEKILQRSYREFELSYYFLITVLYSVTMMALIPFIKIYTRGITDANYILPVTGVLFVVSSYLHNLKTPQGMLVISAGLYRETRWRSTIQAAIIVLGGLILVPMYSLNGVLLALICSEIYRLIDLMFYIPENVTHLSWIVTGKKILYMMIPFIGSVILSFVLDLKINSYFVWAVYSFALTVIFSFVLLILCLIFNREDMLNVIHRVKRIVR